MRDRLETGCISGSFMGKVIATALEMGECNACMKRIVAAPTAGSCGVLPSVLLSYQENLVDGDCTRLQHHRAYRSVHGGSNVNMNFVILIQQGRIAEPKEYRCCKRGVKPFSHPPRTFPTVGHHMQVFSGDLQRFQISVAGSDLLPLFPVDSPNPAPEPRV